MIRLSTCTLIGATLALLAASRPAALATPPNRAALAKHYDRFLAKRLDNCATCHLPAKSEKMPSSLAEFPHNAFGKRLMRAAGELSAKGKQADIAARLRLVAREDADGDGTDNETELLLGHAPGDRQDRPTRAEMARAKKQSAAFAKFLASYRWQPFDPVRRPAVPKIAGAGNPVDAFLAAGWKTRGLKPRPEASKPALLRRVTLDLVGLSPTPEELRAFLEDKSPNAYEKVVDRLLASPRYGERWARHWMDIWRYSDWAGWTDGGQVRDSKPHIWRWRDWIVESLNRDKRYDRMLQEMLAADELAPGDTDALRATGFLVRNYKLLSREQWMEDTLNHTFRAFLGVTLHCAKCHDHMTDPVSQKEYYRVRAIFEPYNVRTDRVPGELDTAKDGLVLAYDADPNAATYFYPRGDERHPDKDQKMEPGLPAALGGSLRIAPVTLPRLAVHPDRREFVVKAVVAASEKAAQEAAQSEEKLKADANASPGAKQEAAQRSALALAKRSALLAVLSVEKIEDAGGARDSDAWKRAAQEAAQAQRAQAVAEAALNLTVAQNALAGAQAKADAAAKGSDKALQGKAEEERTAAEKKVAEAEQALKAAKEKQAAPPATDFTPRSPDTFPPVSTGRRLAFARWLTDPQNPLAARVAVNHLWARHFGQGIVPSVDNFGRNGRPPSHPQLLDWLAAEFMANGWRMKPLHRLVVTSRAYRMASTPDAADLKRDPDNVFLWRMPSLRLEAEAIRDNVLYVSGQLDETRGGPDIDHQQGLTSRRRSLYLRHAAEKRAEFLQIFDGPSVTECYERRPSVMPQQALALANSVLAQAQAKHLAGTLSAQTGGDAAKFTQAAFLRVLARRPTPQEQKLCTAFLNEQARRLRGLMTRQPKPVRAEGKGDKSAPDADRRARENLILVLFNHNDFVTVR